MSNIGYDDTPFLPEPYSQWRVHDGQRPQPTIVTPGATSADAPSDAVILFDGTDLSGWQTTSGGQPEWIVENGYMQVTPRTGDIVTKAQFGDCQLHLEWASPAEVKGESQGRGSLLRIDAFGSSERVFPHLEPFPRWGLSLFCSEPRVPVRS